MEYQIALRNLGHLAFDERSKIVEARGIFRFDIFEIYNTKFREKVILKGSYQGKVYAPETTYIKNLIAAFQVSRLPRVSQLLENCLQMCSEFEFADTAIPRRTGITCINTMQGSLRVSALLLVQNNFSSKIAFLISPLLLKQIGDRWKNRSRGVRSRNFSALEGKSP